MKIDFNKDWLAELTKKMNTDFNKTIHKVLQNNEYLTVDEKVDKIVLDLEKLGYSDLDKKQLTEITKNNQISQKEWNKIQ